MGIPNHYRGFPSEKRSNFQTTGAGVALRVRDEEAGFAELCERIRFARQHGSSWFRRTALQYHWPRTIVALWSSI